MAKQWTIPTILRELQRVMADADGIDIMDPDIEMSVSYMVDLLKDVHMQKEMELPGQFVMRLDADEEQE